MAIPDVLKGNDVLIASETGSGKTLSFLLPIIQRLKQEELNQRPKQEELLTDTPDAHARGFQRRHARPRAIILNPVRELADQTLVNTSSASSC